MWSRLKPSHRREWPAITFKVTAPTRRRRLAAARMNARDRPGKTCGAAQSEEQVDGTRFKEVVGLLMRVLGGGEVSHKELDDLGFEADGELETALNEAYVKLREFANDRD